MMASIMYVIREKRRTTGENAGFTNFFQEEIVFMLSAMMLCISFMQQKNKWEWNWRIETNVDDRK